MHQEEPLSRFGALLEAGQTVSQDGLTNSAQHGRERMWRGFMSARIFVSSVLLALFAFFFYLGQTPHRLAIALSVAYWLLTVVIRWRGPQGFLAAPAYKNEVQFDPHWLLTVGADVLVFGILLHLQAGGINNFAALFALPILQAAVLGSLLLALGTAAVVTLTLLTEAFQYSLGFSSDATARYAQTALTSAGLFALAFLAHQLAARLAKEELASRGSEMAARTQIQVNQLVIDALSDGVLVIDAQGIVHAANPAAIEMLGAPQGIPFELAARSAWRLLADMASRSIEQAQPLMQDISIGDARQAPRQLHIKTKLSNQQQSRYSLGSKESPVFCVMFMEDLREMQARLRTEKLAAMGRMSAAVAHEIRNPLSAISQANALMSEEMNPAQAHDLTIMIAQNVKRIARVVDDVLDVSRAQSSPAPIEVLRHASGQIEQICREWMQSRQAVEKVGLSLDPSTLNLRFEIEHLRRVLVNLLDNALRHASGKDGCIHIELQAAQQWAKLSVWSDGTAIEQGVQNHLFEPFFSSQSRSSGLGLYICRELCTRHGAHIAYERGVHPKQMDQSGNRFFVQMQVLS